jgi:hypothetical protein
MKGNHTHIQSPGIFSAEDDINHACIWQAWHSLSIGLSDDQRFQFTGPAIEFKGL